MTDQTRPDYYNVGQGRDLITLMQLGLFTRDQTVGFLRGNILKYVLRYQRKNGVADLRKAREYLDRLIDWEQQSGRGEDETD